VVIIVGTIVFFEVQRRAMQRIREERRRQNPTPPRPVVREVTADIRVGSFLAFAGGTIAFCVLAAHLDVPGRAIALVAIFLVAAACCCAVGYADTALARVRPPLWLVTAKLFGACVGAALFLAAFPWVAQALSTLLNSN
jgi:hypothetical protein